MYYVAKDKNDLSNKIFPYYGIGYPANRIVTTRVTDMSDFFDYGAVRHDISNWDTSNVINMEGMFDHVEIFNSDISKWDVSNVRNMAMMFDQSWFN